MTPRAHLAVLGSALLLVGAYRTLPSLPDRVGREDFAHYYAGAAALAEGRSPYALDIHTEYERWDFTTERRGWTQAATNPPTLQTALVPLTALPPKTAYWTWTLIQFLSLVAVVALSTHLVGLSCAAGLLVLGIVGASNATFQHFWFAQAQLPVLALLLSGVALTFRGRETMGGAVFTAAASLKLFPLLALPWLVWRSQRSWKVMLGGGAVLLLTIVPLWPLWKNFLAFAVPVVTENAVGQRYNYGVPGLLLNAMLVTGVAPETAYRWAAMSGFLFVAAVYGVFWRRPMHCVRELAVLLTVAVASSVVAWAHYWVFLTPMVALLLSRLLRLQQRADLAALTLLGLFLFFVGVPFPDPGPLTSLPWLLVHYVPLFLLLTLVAWFATRRPPECERDQFCDTSRVSSAHSRA